MESAFASEVMNQLEKENSDSSSNDEKIEENYEYDLQKELEAKFDELFGPVDENE